jgi:NAD(P)H dehydrogenase (quinone)
MPFLNSHKSSDRPLTVLVIGASGQTGREVISSLTQFDPSVRVLAGVRDRTKGETLFGHNLSVETIELDTAKDDVVDAALQGVDRIVLISPISPATPENNTKVMRAAEQAGIGFVVQLSGLSGTRYHDAFKVLGQYAVAMEAPVRQSQLPFTILQPCMFLQNLLTIYGTELAQDHTMTCPIPGDQVIAYIDIRDVAACISKVVLMPELYCNQTLYPTAPRLVSHHQLLNMLSAEMGQHFTYREIPFNVYQENLVQAGVSEWESRIWVDAHYGFTFQGEPPVSVVTSVVEDVLSRKPLDPSIFIQQFARSSTFRSRSLQHT